MQEERQLKRQESRRNGWLVVAACLGVVLVALLALLGLGYVTKWEWVGVANQAEPNTLWGWLGVAQETEYRTLWDWLDLLIVPVVVAIGVLLLQHAQRVRELDVEDQRAQDTALLAYFSQIGQLMLEQNLRNSESSSDAQTLARAWTLTVLPGLNASRKRQFLRFLVEAKLITQPPAINLRDADLSGADLTNISLHNVDLYGVNLRDADLTSAQVGTGFRSPEVFVFMRIPAASISTEPATLRRAQLSNASLASANFVDVDLSGANLSGANLSGANLSGANLSEANLSEANLSGANLSDAKLSDPSVMSGSTDLLYANLRGSEALGWTEEQLATAKSLEGATMPDGQILKGPTTPDGPTFVEWRKSRGEDGKDSGPS